MQFVVQKLVNKIKQDKEWLSSISEELNCNEANEVEKKIKDKMRKIMESTMHGKRLEMDKEDKHIIFPLFVDATSFLEEICNFIMCDLEVNELSHV